MNKATLYPMMATLTEAGWLVRDPVARPSDWVRN